MELIKAEMPKEYTAIDAKDLHVGTINCHYDGIENLVRRALRNKSYIFLTGDLIEAIVPGDKRYSTETVDKRFKTPLDQIEYLVEVFRPVKDQILAVGIGNHEYKLINTVNVIKVFCDRIGLDYNKTYGTAIYKFIATRKGKVMHKFLLTHGNKYLPSGAKDPIQREANKKAAQKRILEELGFSDCIYASQGHHHQLVIVEPTVENHLYLTDDGDSIKQKYRVQSKQNLDYIPPESRWFAGTASYRKTYCRSGSKAVDYGEGKYAPAPLGHVELTVKDGELIKVEPYLA